MQDREIAEYLRRKVDEICNRRDDLGGFSGDFVAIVNMVTPDGYQIRAENDTPPLSCNFHVRVSLEGAGRTT